MSVQDWIDAGARAIITAEEMLRKANKKSGGQSKSVPGLPAGAQTSG